jgi:hypothetical protein
VGSDLTPLNVEQSELVYHAALDPPAFDLAEHWGALQSAIYAHLRRFKLRLSDIKVESATSNPGDLSVACWMFNYGALARYRLDRVEVWSNSQRVADDTDLAADMVAQAMAVLRSVSPGVHVALHSTNVALHGSLPDQSRVAARIASYVTKQPDGPPSLTPSGVSFLSEFPEGRGQGSIILERSALVPDGAFVRVISEHVGSLSEAEALNQAVEFFQASTAQLGLDVVWRV